ncbi:MAG: PAS domain S-box protein [Planctomycetes bacterium]|nr:PAS domain S-box protein [Planctomycetota bacterium]
MATIPNSCQRPPSSDVGCLLDEPRGDQELPQSADSKPRADDRALRSGTGTALCRKAETTCALLNAALDAALLVGRDGTILAANETAARQLAHPVRELVGANVYDRFPAQVSATRRAYAAEVLRSGRPASFQDKSGDAVMDVCVYPVCDTAGQVRQLAFYVADITERNRAEQALRRSERRYRELYESSRDGFALVDLNGRILECNSTYRKMVGYSEDELRGMAYMVLTPEKWHAFEARIIAEQVLVRGYSDVYEKECVRKDGTVFPIEVRAHVLKDGSGAPAGMWGFVRDVTERKQAEQELRASEERLRAIADHGYDLELWIDTTGRLVWVNPAVERLTGYSVTECTAMPNFPIPLAAEEDRERATRAFHRAVAGSTGNDVPFRIRRKGGALVWVAASWQPIYDRGGVSLGCRVSVRDITERVHAEELARQRQRELAHVSRVSLIGEMASGLAHELNQPLCGILAAAHGSRRLLAAGAEGYDGLVHGLDVITAQAKRAGEIVRRMRDFVRKQPPRQGRIDINDVVREVARFVEAEAARRGMHLHLELGPDLPSIAGDAVQIQQVLMNLVWNGLDAMDGSSLARPTLTIETALREGGLVEVVVLDEGGGITPNVQQHMFDAFFTTKPGGMGMGLAICRSLVESHGGMLTVTNTARGARLSVRLPADSGAARDER